MRKLLLIPMCAMLFLGLFGHAWAQNELGIEIPKDAGVIIPEQAPTIKTLRVDDLWVASKFNRVIVKYTTEKFNGEISKKSAEFSLDSDRSIHYKMGMLMLLKEAMENDSLEVRFGFKEGRGKFTDNIIDIVLLTRK